jgi:hypothetical protein
MFFEKETNGWFDKLGPFYERPDGIDVAKTRYEDQHLRGTGNSEFLRQWKRFADAFAAGDRAAVCWNNLMKMDWHRPKRGCVAAATSPKNRTCEFPRIRLEHSQSHAKVWPTPRI